MDEPNLAPERLDALIDGDAPTTADERAIVGLAARMRAASPQPSEQLRRAVSAFGEPARRRSRAPLRMRPGLGPALAATLVLIVGTGVVMRSSGGSSESTGPDVEAAVQQATTASDFAEATPDRLDPAKRTSDGVPPSAQTQSQALESVQDISYDESWVAPPGTLDTVAEEVQGVASRERTISIIRTATSIEVTIPAGTQTRDERADAVRRVLADAGAHPASAPTPGVFDSTAPLRIVIVEEGSAAP